MLLAVNSFPKGTVLVIENSAMRRLKSWVARFGSSVVMSAEKASSPESEMTSTPLSQTVLGR